MKSKTLYENDTEIKKKIEIICKEIYRAKAVDWSPKAQKSLAMLDDFSQFPVCMAKSPLSINENNKIPFEKDKHIIHITDIIIQAGAGFVVALTGEVNLLPGLPIDSRALHVDLDDDGKIVW